MQRSYHLDFLSYYSLLSIPGLSGEIVRKARKVSLNQIPLLITGESGVGKEVLARAIHYESKNKGSFIAVNCAAIPESLAERELFGHEPGSFTGAKERKLGKFQLANEGTIFLDEIADMPFNLQAKLLRVIEEKEVWRVGAEKPEKVNFKLISVTNADIEKFVEKGAFRRDLYHRIEHIRINLPPLRDRMECFDELIRHFLKKYGGQKISFSSEVMNLMKAYSWPGNIRELEQVVNLAVVEKKTSEDRTITAEDLPEKLRVCLGKIPMTLSEKIDALKKKEIKKVLAEYDNNKTKVAEELGVSRKGLLKMMKRLKM